MEPAPSRRATNAKACAGALPQQGKCNQKPIRSSPGRHTENRLQSLTLRRLQRRHVVDDRCQRFVQSGEGSISAWTPATLSTR
jgi:hypothetical protein